MVHPATGTKVLARRAASLRFRRLVAIRLDTLGNGGRSETGEAFPKGQAATAPLIVSAVRWFEIDEITDYLRHNASSEYAGVLGCD